MKRLFDVLRLRDPAWQAIGVIIAVAGLIISIAVSYDIYRQSVRGTALSITPVYYFNPLQFTKTPRGRVTLSIDGAATDSARILGYQIQNSGANPILPEDYIQPIAVSAVEPCELLAVLTEKSTPDSLDAKWTKVATNTFQLEPLLLNPEDSIRATLLVSEAEKTWAGVEWTGRIVNVKSFEDKPSAPTLPFLNLVIYHHSWGLYALVIGSLVVFMASIMLSIRSGRLVHLALRQLVLVAALSVFSFSVVEIIVDTIEGGALIWVEWCILVSSFGLLLYLVWPLVAARMKTMLGPPAEPEGRDDLTQTSDGGQPKVGE